MNLKCVSLDNTFYLSLKNMYVSSKKFIKYEIVNFDHTLIELPKYPLKLYQMFNDLHPKKYY